MKFLACLAAGLVVACSSASAAEPKDNAAARRLGDAAEVIADLMKTPDKSIPHDLLDRSECIVVVPRLKKGAFIVGGKYGRGFVTCRGRSNVGWSAPAGVRVEGGSFGFQIGGSETDVLMLVLNRRGMDKLFKSKFTLGADAAVAAGPLGRTTAAETDALMHAEILTYSRTRGLFAGIALNGATLRPDEDANQEMYGKDLENRYIVTGGVKAPAAARPMLSLLNKYSSRK